jgi:G3E family GTPase
MVTLVGGFLGAGKTSLLHHFLAEQATEPVAIFVEEIDPAAFDLKALRGLSGVMQRTDLVEQIPTDADAEWWKEIPESCPVLIEVAGTTNPARLLKFFPDQEVRIVCVVDAIDLYHAVIGPQRAGKPAVFFDFLRGQILSATHLVLNKCDVVNAEERGACREFLREIYPAAKIIETSYGELPGDFWQEEKSIVPPILSEEVDTPGLGASLYRVYRPFHSERFWNWFQADHPGLLRVKGIVWLATRNLLVGGISRTRLQNSCGGAGIWWAALPREEWPSEPAALARMQETWREPYGDRRQELLLIGDQSRLANIIRQLESCLLTPEEVARPVAEWMQLPDPFPEWDVS